MKRLLPLIFMTVLINGCASLTGIEDRDKAARPDLVVELPEGWKRINLDEHISVLTKEGISLQKIVVARLDIDAKDQFSHTKKRIAPGMLPQEIAEVVVDDIELDKGISGVVVEENTPANIAGRPGFKLVFSYLSRRNLTYRCIDYGFVTDNCLYTVMYAAPKRYYFDKDLNTFEQTIISLKLSKPVETSNTGRE